jgi:uncharacterized repeat protein (TIGR01451 family)
MYSHENVYVGYSLAYSNPGNRAMTTNSGSGIVLGSVNGGTIEHSIAHSNGIDCTAGECGVGIWTYDSNRVTIQYNESYGNRTGSTADGDGFDLDQNSSNCIVQYNYSHNNDGAGFLMAHSPNNTAHYGHIIRYNISENDGRKLSAYAGIQAWGRIRSSEIYNNTIFLSPNAAGGLPRGILLTNWAIETQDASGLHFRNNLIYAKGNNAFVEVTSGQVNGATDILFQGNAYHTTGTAQKFIWGSTTHSSLSSWQNATNQEKLNGVPTGFVGDPLLTSPGTGGTIGDTTKLSSLTAYQLQSTSPLIDKGLNLNSLFSLSIGTRDFYGNTLPQGAGFDIGAHEGQSGTTPTTYTLTVNSGSGGGSYAPGTVVTITANTPPVGQIFSQWTGAIVTNPAAAQTTILMPSANTTVTATYKPIANLAITITPDKYSAMVGETITYTVTYVNNSSSAAAPVVLKAPLPLGTTYLSATGSGTYDSGTRTVKWNLPSVAGNGQGTLTYQIRID